MKLTRDLLIIILIIDFFFFFEVCFEDNCKTRRDKISDIIDYYYNGD
jgi:hypothetical protein